MFFEHVRLHFSVRKNNSLDRRIFITIFPYIVRHFTLYIRIKRTFSFTATAFLQRLVLNEKVLCFELRDFDFGWDNKIKFSEKAYTSKILESPRWKKSISHSLKGYISLICLTLERRDKCRGSILQCMFYLGFTFLLRPKEMK